LKILTVAIPNHHFFQWVNQLEDAGHEVFWFDITDAGPASSKIEWVTQIKGWRLRWDFPMRSKFKRYLPSLYFKIQQWNECEVAGAFAKAYGEIQPDIVHCFEMQLAGLPILPVLEKCGAPVIYSTWGSDMFDYGRLGISKNEVAAFLKRVNYLITDCKRDQIIAKQNGFSGMFLGVFPGNGGLDLEEACIKRIEDRNVIIIKGYEDGVGKAAVILEGLEFLGYSYLKGIDIIIYSADKIIESQIRNSKVLNSLAIKVYSRHLFVQNTDLLTMMGKSSIHIANSLSDGIPNALLEAMGMGAFPIQSNPGKVTEEVIRHGENGFLIKDPLCANEIASLLKKAIDNPILRKKAQEFNTSFIYKNYNRSILQASIVSLYEQIYSNHYS
jgi:glycosyltransferase involved in cell wall biosynthesis